MKEKECTHDNWIATMATESGYWRRCSDCGFEWERVYSLEDLDFHQHLKSGGKIRIFPSSDGAREVLRICKSRCRSEWTDDLKLARRNAIKMLLDVRSATRPI